MLRQAIANGFNDAAHMKEDSDRKPLRSREHFKRIVQELEEKAKTDSQ